MKNVRLLAVMCCLVSLVSATSAQEEVVVTSSGGIITTIEPAEHRILLRAGEAGEPTPFYYTEKTTIIDSEDGFPRGVAPRGACHNLLPP